MRMLGYVGGQKGAFAQAWSVGEILRVYDGSERGWTRVYGNA